MPILTIRHVTTYQYRRPVAFGEHVMMLQPRDDGDQTVLESGARDHAKAEPNCPGPGTPSAIMSRRRISPTGPQNCAFRKHDPPRPRTGRVRPCRRYRGSRPNLPVRLHGGGSGRRSRRSWRRSGRTRASIAGRPGFSREDGSADTRELLVGITRTIKRTCRHVARHEKGVQSPAETLERASGSCRDLAVLMIAALRSLGFAARFVSGYLRVADDNDSLTGGNTHAWAQVYRSRARAGSISIHRAVLSEIEDLVRVAVVHEPRRGDSAAGYLVRDCVGSCRHERRGQGDGRRWRRTRNAGRPVTRHIPAWNLSCR